MPLRHAPALPSRARETEAGLSVSGRWVSPVDRAGLRGATCLQVWIEGEIGWSELPDRWVLVAWGWLFDGWCGYGDPGGGWDHRRCPRGDRRFDLLLAHARASFTSRGGRLAWARLSPVS